MTPESVDTGHTPPTLDETAPGLIEVLTYLGDEYGPSGVLSTVRLLWPDAVAS